MSQRVCEVCGVDHELAQRERTGRDDAGRGDSRAVPSAKLERRLIEGRLVALCPAHAKKLDSSRVTSLTSLFALLRSDGEQRSALGRRSPLDRRVFPPRPEGRRLGDGRRSRDE